jgi:UDP-glucose 4-epimerase
LGDDHSTPDGTSTRDYIHVRDLIAAQVRALEARGSILLGNPELIDHGVGQPASAHATASC